MEIAFRTRALRTVCLSASALDNELGADGGAVLRRFLADLRAAETLLDVPLLVLSPTEGLENGAVIDVGMGIAVAIKANHQRPPQARNGKIDWLALDRILIQQIDRVHA